MPINYDKYPPNWLTEIRPRILKRSNNTCEHECCDFKHLEYVWSVSLKKKVVGWYRDYDVAKQVAQTLKKSEDDCDVKMKEVKVVLTIAHLDHDETNFDVQDERLAAYCQLHHLRHDAQEKINRLKK